MRSTVTDMMASVVNFTTPEVALVGTACILFTMAALSPRRTSALFVSLLGIGCAIALAIIYGPTEAPAAGFNRVAFFHSSIDPSGPASFVRWVSLISGVVFAFTVYSETSKRNGGEYYGCLMVLIAGLSMIGRANDLITLFLALEMVSIPTYVMLYLPIQNKSSQEAAIKYFLLSILSSAIMLFGLSYLYGTCGTTNLAAMADFLSHIQGENDTPLELIGAMLVIVGVGFRIAAVPFHFYAPDVYQAGPTGVVSILAVVPKIAGFVALAKILGQTGTSYAGQSFDANSLVPYALWFLACISMTFGNIVAMLQDNLKRMMAYSGIAHAGYLLIGATATLSGKGGLDATYFYLVAYGLMAAGFFAVLRAIESADRPVTTVDDLAGLATSRPLMAVCMGISLISMIGLPLTAGFFGKLQLFLSAFQAPLDTPMGAGYRTLAYVGAVNAAIGAVYYLRVLGAIYLRTPLVPFAIQKSYTAGFAAVLCTIGTLFFGFYPKPLGDMTKKATPAVVSNIVAAPLNR